jgi:stage V sporulation protein SpoVS
VSQANVLVNQDDITIRVRPNSPVQQVANSIRIAIFEEHRMPIIRAVGAGGVNQACKAIAIARGLVATQGFDLSANIGFTNVTGEDGAEITALAFHLFVR